LVAQPPLFQRAQISTIIAANPSRAQAHC